MEEESDSKLYIRAACSVCLKGRRKGVFVNCPYCDIDRKQIVEASFQVIKESLNRHLSSQQKEELIKELSK